MLGDQLLWQEGRDLMDFVFVPNLYRPETCSPENYQLQIGRHNEVAKLFRDWIARHQEGWVRVLKYNERLVFLKGENGDYDFLFPELRDEPFNHNPFHPYLKNGDVPKSHDTYHFRRWLYFEYIGWLEKEIHDSEITFYTFDGTPLQHPGQELVLKQHLIRKKTYKPPQKSARSSEGFFPVQITGQKLLVSNLVTIAQFQQFIAENQDYAAYRCKSGKVDRWETVNCDENQTLPAAVTWYDANAFAAWISRSKHLPVRLLTEEEYLQIAPADKVGLKKGRLCLFQKPDGTPIEGHPHYMPEEEFQNLRLTFIPGAIRWEKSAAGLNFLVSPDFGEWLNQEAAAINTQTKKSLCYPDFVASKGLFAATSTGKYKSKKVGFRLCYLTETPQGESAPSTTVTQ